LIEEVAHGGMGVVYRANDTVLGREVAVKVLHNRFGTGSVLARRFVEEARITGQLQHPTIPPVHDCGVLPDGRPFLAMKLIRGSTLDKLLDERPHPAANLMWFIGIFEQVCQALAYAHAHRVIHRDLKPANVMVGAYGEVQVMDWGLAKVLTAEPYTPDSCPGLCVASDPDTNLTQAGSLLGTPAFMPPEQATGAALVDKRADVFGLGAILCVILTGRPPYVGEDASTLHQKAIRAELADALARLDGCGADTVLIDLCHACLATNPTERPESAGVVAQAVAEYRGAVAERARRAEIERAAAEARALEETNTRRAIQERATEQVRRRRWQAAVAAAGVLLLGLIALGAWWADHQGVAHRAEVARVEAERTADALREQIAEKGRAEAERERLARNAHVTELALGHCEEALRNEDTDRAAINLEAAERRLSEGGGDQLRARFVRCKAEVAMLRDLDILNEAIWTPEAGKLPGAAVLSPQWAEVFSRFGIVPGKIPTDVAARQVTESLIKERLLYGLDYWLWSARTTDPTTADALVLILKSVDPDPYRNAVREAIRSNNSKQILELAEEKPALAQPPWFASVLGHAGIPRERRRQILQIVLHKRPGDLNILMTLGGLYPGTAKADLTERVRWLQAAVAAHPRNIPARNNLGNALSSSGDKAGAEAEFREALRVNPDSPRVRCNLGNLLGARGDYDEAEVEFLEVLRLDPKYAIAHFSLANMLRKKGEVDSAIEHYKEGIEINAALPNPHSNLAKLLLDRGDLDGAIEHCQTAIRLDPKLHGAHQNLGHALLAKKEWDKAAAAFRTGIKLEPSLPDGHFWLGMALKNGGKLNEAETEIRKALQLEPAFKNAPEELDQVIKLKAERETRIAPPPREIKR
jgi:tetratricopeptide (TPR) repeat protein